MIHIMTKISRDIWSQNFARQVAERGMTQWTTSRRGPTPHAVETRRDVNPRQGYHEASVTFNDADLQAAHMENA